MKKFLSIIIVALGLFSRTGQADTTSIDACTDQISQFKYSESAEVQLAQVTVLANEYEATIPVIQNMVDSIDEVVVANLNAMSTSEEEEQEDESIEAYQEETHFWELQPLERE